MEQSSDKQYRKMVETPVSKLVILLGIPTTISMLVTNLYNMADTYFVSKLGNSASGAVGVVFGLMAILQACGFMFGHGAGSIISRKLGAKDIESARKFASTSFFSSILFGSLIGLLGLLFTSPLMRLLGSTKTILPYANDYAKYILIAAPLMTSSFVMNNILRYEGKAALAMIGLTIGGILNILGDYIFMELFHLGVDGAGLSTALSQTISFLILLTMFLTGKTQSKFRVKYITKDIHDFTAIIKTGFPSLIRQGLSSVSTMVLNNQAGLYGDAAIAAMTIVNRISFFLFACGLGIGQGFQPVVAFNYGAGKFNRVRKSYKFTVIFSEIFLGILVIIGIILSPDLIGLFRDDNKVIAIGTVALVYQLISLLFYPLSVSTNMMFQCVGKYRAASLLSMLRSGLFFIPIIYLFTFLFGLTGIEISQFVADILTFFVTIPFILKFMKELPKIDG